MLNWLFIILFISALIFMFFAIDKFREGDMFWAFIFSILDTVLWFFLAANMLEIEASYEIYNATSGQVETGIHTITSKVAPEMVYFLQIPGIIMMIFTIVQVFLTASTIFKNKKNDKMI